MAMRYPKLIKGGTRINQLVMNVDMAPTMLTLGGGKLPAELRDIRYCRCSKVR